MNFNQQAVDIEMLIISSQSLEEKIDHMVELSHVLLYKSGGAQQSLKFSLEAHRLAVENGYERGIAWSSYEIGRAYCSQADQINGFRYLHDSLKNFTQLGDLNGKALALKTLATLYDVLSMRDVSLELHMQALEVARQIGDKTAESGILTNLGGTMQVLHRYEEGIEYLLAAIEIEDALPVRSPGSAIAYVNLAELYKETGDREKARECAERCIAIAEEMGEPVSQAYGFTSLGNLYREDGDLGKALAYFQRGMEIVDRNEMKYDKLPLLTGLFKLHLQKGDTQKALEYLIEAEVLARSIGSTHRLCNILALAASLYEKLLDYKNAYTCHVEAVKLEKEALNRELEQKLNLLTAKHQIVLAEKEAEIARLKAATLS